ncbi:hypothetical protein E2C01_097778 [Portunus trituberculatus]|uniref:Uncharacterized protein n=1 Tax=Portunus trituberculatus TaxID=210409 RepID=A0A5B7JZI6_PORTR|nr:hypothetical protein [Portunus trituberculatus]
MYDDNDDEGSSEVHLTSETFLVLGSLTEHFPDTAACWLSVSPTPPPSFMTAGDSPPPFPRERYRRPLMENDSLEAA